MARFLKFLGLGFCVVERRCGCSQVFVQNKRKDNAPLIDIALVASSTDCTFCVIKELSEIEKLNASLKKQGKN